MSEDEPAELPQPASNEGALDAVPSSEARATVFVSDPSAEAERVAQMLRGAGYLVVDVPMAMLVARVAVQTPSVIVVDADAFEVEGALEKVRGTPEGAAIDVILLGQARPDWGPAEREPAAEVSGFFARPVDPSALLRKIELLTGGSAPVAPPSTSLRSLPPLSAGPPTSVRPWGLGAPERRSPIPASAPLSARPPPSSGSHWEAVPSSVRADRPGISIQTSLSPELEALLDDAERRVGSIVAHEAMLPTPEEEIEAVLPAALLAALDEPIEEDEDDMLADAGGPRSNVAPSESDAQLAPPGTTNAGRALTPEPSPAALTRSIGVAPTMAAPAMGTTLALPRLQPPAPSRELTGRLAAEPPATKALVVGAGDVPRIVAEAVVGRESGCYCFEAPEGLRRVLFRDGDIVTAASSSESETLLGFMTARGDVRREQVKDLVGKVPPYGRHAGAALVGHGLLRQDQLWPVLRAHAEWILGRTLLSDHGTSRLEAEAPGRLRLEPGVFGGSSGAEVVLEVARRVIPPEEALRRLGGASSTVSLAASTLLSECALDAHERALVEEAGGATLEELLSRAAGADIATVFYCLSLLGVVVVRESDLLDEGEKGGAHDRGSASDEREQASAAAILALDTTAVRERVRARYDLVAEADYFSLLGVARQATGYEVRRAYLELRRAFEPSRILTPELADLESNVRTIVLVLDEAYEILRDGARRERYRRALGELGERGEKVV